MLIPSNKRLPSARKAAIVEGIDAEAERERLVNQDRARQLALEEQRRRMAEDGGVPSPDHEARHDAIVQDLFHHENLDKLERKQRAVSRLEIEDQVEQRRWELVEEWHGKVGFYCFICCFGEVGDVEVVLRRLVSEGILGILGYLIFLHPFLHRILFLMSLIHFQSPFQPSPKKGFRRPTRS